MTTAAPDVLEELFASIETDEAPPCEWNLGDERRPPCTDPADFALTVKCLRHKNANRHLLCSRHKERMEIVVATASGGRCNYVISQCEPLR